MCNVVKGLRRFSTIAKLCMALALTATVAHAQSFSITTLPTTGTDTYPTMVTDAKGNVNLAWIDSAKGIMFARSTDGKSFPTQFTVQAQPFAGASALPAFPPQMAVYATQTNVIVIVWAAPDPTSTPTAPLYDVFAARSDQSGANFVTSTNLSGPVALAGSPRVAFDFSGGVNVVWGMSNVWISRAPSAVSFGARVSLVPVAVPQPVLHTGGPRVIASATNHLFVAWTDEEAEIEAKPLNFCTFPTKDATGKFYTNTFGGNVYMNETLPDVNGSPTGLSANNTRNLSTTDWNAAALGVPPPNPEFPAGFFGCSFNNLTLFTGKAGLVHLLWSDDQPGEDILTSSPHGTNASNQTAFSFPGNLASLAASSPSVATDANSIYVAWSGGPTGPASSEGIFVSRSDDDGSTFTAICGPNATSCNPKNIASPAAFAPAYPQIAIDSKGNVSVAWEQANAVVAADGKDTFDVFLASSPNKGASFPTVAKVSTNSSLLCINPPPAPTTPDTTTCGTVQLALDVNSSPVMAWVNKPSAATAAKIDFAATQPPVFSISLGPASASVLAGGTATYTVQVTPGSGFAGPVTLSCSGLPAGASCTLNPATTTATGTSTLTVTTQGTTAAGSSQVTVTGTSPNTTASSTTATFIVGTITAAASANSATIAVGASANFTLNLSSSNGFTGNVNLTCPGVPTGITCTFNPASTAVPGSTTVTVSVGSKPTGSLIQNGPRNLDGPLSLQRNTALSMAFVALALILCGMIAASRRQKPLPLARGLAVMALVMVLAVGLISCGGSTSSTSTGGGTGGGGTGGGTTPFNGQIVVQAQSGAATTNLSTLSITVP
jgi:hypothetical protein